MNWMQRCIPLLAWLVSLSAATAPAMARAQEPQPSYEEMLVQRTEQLRTQLGRLAEQERDLRDSVAYLRHQRRRRMGFALVGAGGFAMLLGVGVLADFAFVGGSSGAINAIARSPVLSASMMGVGLGCGGAALFILLHGRPMEVLRQLRRVTYDRRDVERELNILEGAQPKVTVVPAISRLDGGGAAALLALRVTR